MVTEEVFYKVQAILDGRNRNAAPALARRNQDSPDFPLRRIVKCSRCQHSFTAAWSKGKKNRYGYYFCPKRCASGSSVPVKQVEDTTAELLARISLRPEAVKVINAFLRQTYYLRIGALRKKREQADIELQRLHELRQKLIEKNLSGIYSDDIFKEQNKLLEDLICTCQVICDGLEVA